MIYWKLQRKNRHRESSQKELMISRKTSYLHFMGSLPEKHKTGIMTNCHMILAIRENF